MAGFDEIAGLDEGSMGIRHLKAKAKATGLALSDDPRQGHAGTGSSRDNDRWEKRYGRHRDIQAVRPRVAAHKASRGVKTRGVL